nr:MAG TPA: hypothetical protein [Bacteriophage sp.]
MGNPWSCQVKKQSRMPRPTPSDRSGSVPKFEAHLYKSYGLMQPAPSGSGSPKPPVMQREP